MTASERSKLSRALDDLMETPGADYTRGIGLLHELLGERWPPFHDRGTGKTVRIRGYAGDREGAMTFEELSVEAREATRAAEADPNDARLAESAARAWRNLTISCNGEAHRWCATADRLSGFTGGGFTAANFCGERAPDGVPGALCILEPGHGGKHCDWRDVEWESATEEVSPYRGY